MGGAAAGQAVDVDTDFATIFGLCTEADCPGFYSWTLPHYNAYDVTSENIMSVSKMTEDVGEDFFSAEIGTVIKSPDTPSVTPTASMSPSTAASGTPSNSPLGPYLTTWIQQAPRMKCEEPGDAHREEFNFHFKTHDGTETSVVEAYGNITGYPSKSACYSDWRRIYTVKARGSGHCFIESANKEHYRANKAYTLCSIRMVSLTFQAHRWRAAKRWNDMVSGCRMGNDALPTGDVWLWQPFNWDTMSYQVADGTCEMFYKWNQQLFFTVHQRGHEGVNNHAGHRLAKISDFTLDWIDVDPNTAVGYRPMDRQNTLDNDFYYNYLNSMDYSDNYDDLGGNGSNPGNNL